jgi:hypothetical protein
MTEQRNRIIIFGPKSDGTYVIEFRTAAGESRRGRNGRASERQYLRSAICATRSKGPAVPRSDTDQRTIYLTGIDANGKVARASALQAVQGSELTAR